MKKPVLFLIFNRPDTTKQVFEAIREYRPKQLFIAADGARNEKELKLCNETRDIVKNIDWDCKVETLFREENLGCRNAVSSAIDWFFENVEDGIILEDDCLPNQSFFTFCEDMLDKYKNDENIMHIGGNNFQLGRRVTKNDYYFSKLNHVWGWATWKKSWQKYQIEMEELEPFFKNRKIEKIFKNRKIIKYWSDIFKNVKNKKIDTWAYQWTYSLWLNDGLSILPSKNLVQNIGFNNKATHTTHKPQYIDRFNKEAKRQNYFKAIRHPSELKVNSKADERYHKMVKDSLFYRTIRYIKKCKNEINN
jgi:GR25 family glycosyltransferase involved in LPS biosynthesis